jgi:hypothetical protein
MRRTTTNQVGRRSADCAARGTEADAFGALATFPARGVRASLARAGVRDVASRKEQ